MCVSRLHQLNQDSNQHQPKEKIKKKKKKEEEVNHNNNKKSKDFLKQNPITI